MTINHARLRIAVIGLAVAVTVSITACSSSTPDQPKPSLKPAVVTSSIHNGAALSGPVQWSATVRTSAHNSFIKSVVFWSDGKKLWTEENPPYDFNDDNSLLFPWLLGGGTHVLKVTANMSSGQVASTSSTVTTQAAVVPAGLVGTYTRNVPQSDYGPGFVSDGTPFGVWTLQIKPDGEMIDTVPGGGEGTHEAFTATATTLTMQGYRAWNVPAGYAQGGMCNATPEQPDGYTWSRTGNELTLASPTDLAQCVDRGGLFIGTWTLQ
jgi:hypothetical protein